MCCTFESARLSNTILYIGEAAVEGRVVHVLGYQNTAENLSYGPNAMILPFPSAEPMTQANVLDTSDVPDILRDYEKFAEKPRKLLGGPAAAAASYQVFESGAYTVVLAPKASGILKGLHEVPAEKRPNISVKYLTAYARLYPKWPIALCCFNGDKFVSQPMFWWYHPKNPGRLFVPGLDAHDGEPPRLDERVHPDATVIVSWGDRGTKVTFSKPLPAHLVPYLSDTVLGVKITEPSLNADYIFRSDIIDRRSDLISAVLGREKDGGGRVVPIPA